MNIIERLQKFADEKLKGINFTETEKDYGWWETSGGANFGEEVLSEFLAIIEEAKKQEPVGFVDDFGNFENSLKPWMQEEPNVAWNPVFTHPQLSDETVKDGYVMVPIEPTSEMVKAAESLDRQLLSKFDHVATVQQVYRKMIAEAMKAEKS